jgi:hypothetical protein
VDPRAGLDDMEKLKFFTIPGLELRPLDRPAHCQSLYRLHYGGSYAWKEYTSSTKRTVPLDDCRNAGECCVNV